MYPGPAFMSFRHAFRANFTCGRCRIACAMTLAAGESFPLFLLFASVAESPAASHFTNTRSVGDSPSSTAIVCSHQSFTLRMSGYDTAGTFTFFVDPRSRPRFRAGGDNSLVLPGVLDRSGKFAGSGPSPSPPPRGPSGSSPRLAPVLTSTYLNSIKRILMRFRQPIALAEASAWAGVGCPVGCRPDGLPGRRHGVKARPRRPGPRRPGPDPDCRSSSCPAAGKAGCTRSHCDPRTGRPRPRVAPVLPFLHQIRLNARRRGLTPNCGPVGPVGRPGNPSGPGGPICAGLAPRARHRPGHWSASVGSHGVSRLGNRDLARIRNCQFAEPRWCGKPNTTAQRTTSDS